MYRLCSVGALVCGWVLGPTKAGLPLCDPEGVAFISWIIIMVRAALLLSHMAIAGLHP